MWPDQVSRNTQIKIVSVIPQLKLATISNNQRLKRSKTLVLINASEEKYFQNVKHVNFKQIPSHLGVIPAKSSSEYWKLSLLCRQQRLESPASKAFLLVIHHSAQVCIDLKQGPLLRHHDSSFH